MQKNGSEKIRKLLESYKKVLIEDKFHYDPMVLGQFGKQIAHVIEHKDPTNGYKLFIDTCKLAFETLFEVVLNFKRNDSVYVVSLFYFQTELKELIQ